MQVDQANINAILYTYIKRLYGKYRLSSNYSNPRKLLGLISILSNHLSDDGDVEECRTEILQYLRQEVALKDKNLIIDEYERLLMQWDDKTYLHLFLIAVYLVLFKEDITVNIKEIRENIQLEAHPLSLVYDNSSSQIPYLKRIHTVLETEKYYNTQLQSNANFRTSVEILESKGVKTFKIYQIIMSESTDQSIKTDSGTGYEKRIANHLEGIGIPSEDLEILNHEEVGSIEHDFKFELEGRRFGISCKRTLRERYKQYVNLLLGFANQEDPTEVIDDDYIIDQAIIEEYGDEVKNLTKESLDVDVLMTVTIGVDLTENKARTIRSFGVYIFVSPEIYNAYEYLQEMNGVYPIEQLTLETLQSLR
ncbi:hypothetical protein MT476_26335 (plasmid) [Bacillus sp. H8-1]|nr:hypothetical protein MT476_26335 [Bacillus sp. H8-1]